MTTPRNTGFAEFLRDKVERLGDGRMAEGTRRAAALGGVSPRIIQLWMVGRHAPNIFTEQGARLILQRAVHVHERDKLRTANK